MTPRGYVSETYKPGDRSHKIPTSTSPLMMTQSTTHLKTKSDFILLEQRPSVLPLAGKGGHPLHFADKKSQRLETTLNLTHFRGNQFKETLSSKINRSVQTSFNVKTNNAPL